MDVSECVRMGWRERGERKSLKIYCTCEYCALKLLGWMSLPFQMCYARTRLVKLPHHPPFHPIPLTQVTVEYRIKQGRMVPVRVHTLVISVQHSPDVTIEQIQKDLMEKVIKVRPD